MFRALAANLANPGLVFNAHPLELVDYLEAVWALRGPPAGLISPQRPDPFVQNSPFQNVVQRPTFWHHLIYAYMIENSRVHEIFRRVILEYVHGERLGVASDVAQLWLRNTENLFFREAKIDSIYSVTSDVRPDGGAVRRNAYFRMFGMDLNHGTDENKPYPYRKAETANRDFVTAFEALLREVWVGIRNVTNTSGGNPTDRESIANHATRLNNMLSDRRQQGNLSREEFMAVATMSWYHLVLEINAPIVVDLEAEATSPYERLRKIGERVGLPAHGKSEDYFRLAEPMSRVIRALETGNYNTAANAPLLFAGPLQPDLYTIITHWASATGRSLKSEAQAAAAS